MLSFEPFPFRDVVLVIDMFRDENSTLDVHRRRDLEMVTEGTLRHLEAALDILGLHIHRYRDPQALTLNAHRHVQDVVLSLYGGSVSRNRTALVSAICEAHGLRYVGTDAYGNIISSDKDISKTLARQCGLETPWHRVIRTSQQLASMHSLPTPFVVKPLWEGSSIGIAQENLVRDVAAGIELASDLIRTFQQPVIVEGFVGGKEVSYSYIEANPADHWAFSEIQVTGNEHYFDSHLLDAAEKQRHHLPRTIQGVDSALRSADREQLQRFLKAFGRLGYCRVDGKLKDGKFVFLEVTPDPAIGPSDAFAAGFISKGWLYHEVIAGVLSTAQLPHAANRVKS